MAASDLKPFGRRAVSHPEAQIGALARLIEHLGFIEPVLLDERNEVLIGWERVLAARFIGIADVPTICITHLSREQKRLCIIASHKIATLAGWDDDVLKAELEELAAAGVDLSLTGFGNDELNALLLPNAGRTDPDDVPDVPPKPVSRPGDIWVLGRHRMACGSSIDKDAVARLLGDARPHLMVTDPPYGVNYDPAWRSKLGLNGDGAALGAVSNDHRADWTEAWALFPGHVAYVWHSALHCPDVHQSLARRGLKVRAQIVWVKARPVISRGHYHWQHETAYYAVTDGADDRFVHDHEMCAYAVEEGETARWAGDRRQTTVWRIDHLKNDSGHSTQKPVECMRRPMVNNSKAGEAVYDPFMGSGTTLIAAEMSGRCAYGSDVDPGYVDVAVLRWQEFTGLEAKLDGDGSTFAAIAKARALA